MQTEDLNPLPTDAVGGDFFPPSHPLRTQTMDFSPVAIAVVVALFASVAAANLRSKSSTAAGLCANVIEPSGFPCAEHTVSSRFG